MQAHLSQELERTVQALAQPFSVQRAIFPDFVALGDELVMEFARDVLHAFGWAPRVPPASSAVFVKEPSTDD